MPGPRTFIVSPLSSDAVRYAQKHRLPPMSWTRLTDPDRLRGINDPHVVILGYPGSWRGDQVNKFERQLILCDRGNALVERRFS